MHSDGLVEKTSKLALVALIIATIAALGMAMIGTAGAQNAVQNNMTYAGDGGNVTAYDADTGAKVWSTNIGELATEVEKSPIKNVVYAAIDDGQKVVALDSSDGKQLWSKSTNVELKSLALSADGQFLYVGGNFGYVKKLDIRNQNNVSVVWSTSASLDNVWSAEIAPDNNQLFVGTYDGNIVSLDTADGTENWRYSMGGTGDIISGLGVSPDGGTVYGANRGTVAAVDAANGNKIWDDTSTHDAYSLDVAPDGSKLVIGDVFGWFRGVDAEDGTVLWSKRPTSNTVDAISYSHTSNLVYAGSTSNSGFITALDGDSGATQWNISDGARSLEGPVELSATISGTVNDTTTKPIENANITAQNPQTGATFQTTTNSDGEYTVAVDPGDYFVKADNGVDSEQQTVSIDSGEQLTDVNFELIGAEGIRGEVRNENGDPLNNINITATSATGAGTYETQTDILGQYSLDLPPGDYFVSAEGPLGTEQQTVTVPDGKIVENVNFVLPVSASISGQVFDTNGDPLENAEVVADPTMNENFTTVSTATNESGYYQLFMENGTYNVTASYQGAAETKNITLDPEQSLTGENFYLDTAPFDPGTLVIDAPKRLNHSATGGFRITWTNDTSGKDVTDQVALQTADGDLITIDNINNKITATSNTSIVGRATVNATYTVNGEQINGSAIVVVAPQEVEYIEILPTLDRFAATMTDNSFFSILISTLLAAAVVPLAGAFSGLAVGTAAMALFWLMGLQTLGMAFLSFFTASFIGLNLAANIDYQVRR